jgi:hypothetical protein
MKKKNVNGLILVKNIELALLKKGWTKTEWAEKISATSSGITYFLERLKVGKKVSQKTIKKYTDILDVAL